MRYRLIAGTINRYPAGEGWTNVHLDKSARPLRDPETGAPRGEAEIILDLTLLAEAHGRLPADTFDEVRCWQVLEHLTAAGATKALQGFRRVLKPGGILDIETPDLAIVTDRFVGTELSLAEFLGNIYGQATGMRDDEFNLHRWGYTAASLRDALELAGFTDLQWAQPAHETATRYRAVSP